MTVTGASGLPIVFSPSGPALASSAVLASTLVPRLKRAEPSGRPLAQPESAPRRQWRRNQQTGPWPSRNKSLHAFRSYLPAPLMLGHPAGR